MAARPEMCNRSEFSVGSGKKQQIAPSLNARHGPTLPFTLLKAL